VINKAFLHPAVRQRLDILVQNARDNGWGPVVRSTVRDDGTQQNLWDRCQRGEGPFPVKEPGCSQHKWGYAFDLVATRGAVVANAPVPGRLSVALCALLGICPDREPGRDTRAAQELLQIQGRRLGLSTSRSDPVHFSVFPSSVWDPHMRSEFGLGCRTCSPGTFLERPGIREFIEENIHQAGLEFPQEI